MTTGLSNNRTGHSLSKMVHSCTAKASTQCDRTVRGGRLVSQVASRYKYLTCTVVRRVVAWSPFEERRPEAQTPKEDMEWCDITRNATPARRRFQIQSESINMYSPANSELSSAPFSPAGIAQKRLGDKLIHHVQGASLFRSFDRISRHSLFRFTREEGR